MLLCTLSRTSKLQALAGLALAGLAHGRFFGRGPSGLGLGPGPAGSRLAQMLQNLQFLYVALPQMEKL